MIFNSLDFAIFLPIVFLIYWNVSCKRIVLLIASYLFYGWWDYTLLSLIFLSSIFDYTIGIQLSKLPNTAKKKRLTWLYISLFLNLGALVYFKYLNFFVETFYTTFRVFGFTFSEQVLSIVLPVGISFYTFQTLSYTIDVYRNKIQPSHDILSFLCYVSFFPQLVAGPIEKAKDLLPQFQEDKNLDKKMVSSGCRQILWGLFQKVVIADNAALFVNHIFGHYSTMNSSTLLFGLFLFSIQIYGDFAGYSHIAIGTARLFGYELKRNFSYPYFSRNLYEFWRRWHISLTDWFRTYLYTALGGNRKGKSHTVRNICIVFLVSGLWHGANETFIVWGALHALLYLPYVWLPKPQNSDQIISLDNPNILTEMGGLLFTNVVLCFSWLFFRAKNITTAIDYLKVLMSGLFEGGRITLPYLQISIVTMFFLILLFILIEWQTKTKNFPLEDLELTHGTVSRYSAYYLIIGAIFWFGSCSQEFLYFQF